MHCEIRKIRAWISRYFSRWPYFALEWNVLLRWFTRRRYEQSVVRHDAKVQSRRAVERWNDYVRFRLVQLIQLVPLEMPVQARFEIGGQINGLSYVPVMWWVNLPSRLLSSLSSIFHVAIQRLIVRSERKNAEWLQWPRCIFVSYIKPRDSIEPPFALRDSRFPSNCTFCTRIWFFISLFLSLLFL